MYEINYSAKRAWNGWHKWGRGRMAKEAAKRILQHAILRRRFPPEDELASILLNSPQLTKKLLKAFRECEIYYRGEWPLWIYDLLDELEKKIKELKKEQEEE